MPSKSVAIAVASLALLLAGGALVYITGLGEPASTAGPSQPLPAPEVDVAAPADDAPRQESIVLAGGCFWCTEAVFEQLAGVEEVVSGYAGGDAKNARYEIVAAGISDHAEAIEITYDPDVISFGTLLKVFFTTAHDPTQLNRQGPDTGRQYRSAVFYSSEEQRKVTEAYIAQLNADEVYSQPIVTTVEPLTNFYPAEEYHQDFVPNNPLNPYVRGISFPKVCKTQDKFPELLKKSPADDEAASE